VNIKPLPLIIAFQPLIAFSVASRLPGARHTGIPVRIFGGIAAVALITIRLL
jgi:hypothetical protein